MITNRRVFDDDWPPRRLDHRDAAVEQLARAFDPALDGQRADDVLIHGASGVGKTVLTRHTLRRLEERAAVDHAFVRCLGLSTAGIVRSVLGDLPGDTPAANTPLEDCCLALRERVDGPVIVVLDEADGLRDVTALDRLADVDGLSMVVVCHDEEDWLSRVDGDVWHRLVGNECHLPRYGVDELADILDERARQGLAPDVVTRRQLETIADRVAGVARFGIQSLLAAAEVATERGHDRVEDDDVDDAFDRARRWIREGNLDSLPFHHHVLYELVRRGGRLSPGELHDRYDRVADDVYRGHDLTPVSERGRRTKLTKLRDYDLIDWEGENRHRRYWARDETVESPIDIELPTTPSN